MRNALSSEIDKQMLEALTKTGAHAGTKAGAAKIVAGQRSLRCEVLNARHDGYDFESGPERQVVVGLASGATTAPLLMTRTAA